MHQFPFLSQLKYKILIQVKLFKGTLQKTLLHCNSNNTLKKLYSKPPKIIFGVSITLMITSGFTFSFSTAASAAAIINEQQIDLVQKDKHFILSNQPLIVAINISRESSSSSSIVNRALNLQGTPYIFGGTSRSGFDCSGFTKYVFAGSGISLPRTSFGQFASGSAIGKTSLQPGDLVFFSTYTKGASHVGIYIGNGRFVHASNPTNGIEVSALGDSFYFSRYLGARRYIEEE